MEGQDNLEGRILVSGASVAGLSLAYWLRRFGVEATVVERAPAPRDGGYAVDLRGAAPVVAKRMGILERVRAAHVGTRGMSYVDAAGTPVASMSADLLGDSGGAIAELEILRGDLVRILYEAVRDDVDFLFDDSITEIAQDEGAAKVAFERAAPRVFDIVVGADGLHSNVRTLVFGEEEAFLRDLGAFVSIFTTENHLDLAGWEQMYSVPGKTAALYPAGHETEAKAMFFFRSPPMPFDRRDVEQQKRMLVRAFEDVGWELPRLLGSLSDAPDFYFDRVAQIRLDRWSDGRVVLVGDAAWCPSPMAGLGTSMALAGAYVLAGELATARGDHRRALAAYESQTRAYVEGGQKLAKGNAAGLIPRSRGQIRMRNLFIRMLPHLPWKGVVTGGVQKAAKAIELKDYGSIVARR